MSSPGMRLSTWLRVNGDVCVRYYVDQQNTGAEKKIRKKKTPTISEMKMEYMKSARRGKNVKKGLLSCQAMLFASNNIIEFKIFRLHGK